MERIRLGGTRLYCEGGECAVVVALFDHRWVVFVQAEGVNIAV